MRNENIRERTKIEKITDRCVKARHGWFKHVETRTRICGKTNTGDGTAREKNKRKTKAEMDRLRNLT